jgi:hypothetical protein
MTENTRMKRLRVALTKKSEATRLPRAYWTTGRRVKTRQGPRAVLHSVAFIGPVPFAHADSATE